MSEAGKPRTSDRGAVTVLKCTAATHADTINGLAELGLIEPVEFTAPDGVRRAANSMWAASDWLKANGYHGDKDSARGNKPIIYHFDQPGGDDR